MSGFQLDTSGAIKPKRVLRLLARIEAHAYKMADEGVYAFSYEVGSTRWEQANARSNKARVSFEKAVAELRDYLGAAQ